jgi:hypothetical protein
VLLVNIRNRRLSGRTTSGIALPREYAHSAPFQIGTADHVGKRPCNVTSRSLSSGRITNASHRTVVDWNAAGEHNVTSAFRHLGPVSSMETLHVNTGESSKA